MMISAAVEHDAGNAPPQPRTGTLRADLIEVLRWLAREIAEQDMVMLAAVLAGMRSDRYLSSAMRSRLQRDQRAMIDGIVHQAHERGEQLNPDAETLFSEVAPAVIVHRLLLVGEDCGLPFLEHLVDDVRFPCSGPAEAPHLPRDKLGSRFKAGGLRYTGEPNRAVRSPLAAVPFCGLRSTHR